MTSHTVRDPAAGAEARFLQADIRFVEFFGLPGIGKTTASSLLAKRLQRYGTTAAEARAVWDKRTFLGRQIYRIGIVMPRLMDSESRSLFVRIVRFVAESGQESVIDLFRVAWNLCAVAAYILDERSRSTSITIMDQGLLQGFWSVLLKSRHRRTSEKWLDIVSAIGVHDMVFVHLRGETGVARGRLLTRGDRSSRMQTASPDSDFDLWSMADRACREMAADLRTGMQAKDHAGMLAAIDAEALASPEEVAERSLQAVLLACRDRPRLRDAASQ